MTVLAINSGSSSIKAALFRADAGSRLLDIRVSGIGESTTLLKFNQTSTKTTADTHLSALNRIFEAIQVSGHDLEKITGVGHRVIHGGDSLIKPTIIDSVVEEIIDSLRELAPLHNPNCLLGIRAARQQLPSCTHVAVFDTAFHSTLPAHIKTYALPRELNQRTDLKRFGFHGISHQYVTNIAASYLKSASKHLKIVSCHLGNGCSVTAVDAGRSIETSMGMTPLEGLVMGTRSGDVDPGVLIKLLREQSLTADQLEDLLNRDSGLIGLTGTNNMSEIEQRAADGDASCQQAIQIFVHRVRKYIGAYAATMGGMDALVFTAGIGENSASIRHRICQRFDYLGAVIDEDRNRVAKVSLEQPVVDISDSTSRVKILLVATDEEAAIATSVKETLRPDTIEETHPPIPVATSARHVHVSAATLHALFGENHQLTSHNPVLQPGQFAANETVTIVGPRNQIEDVRIIGPLRSEDQVEISRSDAFFLGVDAQIRASGDVNNTSGITLLGPQGSTNLHRGVICARRHIHMHPKDAKLYGVSNGDLVSVTIDSDQRDLTFSDVLIRVDDNFKLEMHIDTDEANAADLKGNDTARLVKPINH